MRFEDKKKETIAEMKRRMSLLRSYLRQAEKAGNEHELSLAYNGFWHYQN